MRQVYQPQLNWDKHRCFSWENVFRLVQNYGWRWKKPEATSSAHLVSWLPLNAVNWSDINFYADCVCWSQSALGPIMSAVHIDWFRFFLYYITLQVMIQFTKCCYFAAEHKHNTTPKQKVPCGDLHTRKLLLLLLKKKRQIADTHHESVLLQTRL